LAGPVDWPQSKNELIIYNSKKYQIAEVQNKDNWGREKDKKGQR